jgi:8-oxo-dGTP diphosphatase
VTDRRTIVVTAAVFEDHGAFFVTRRQAGVHLAGCWEFPGGKCDQGESLERCLAREIAEELGCGVEVGRELLTVAHDYPDRRVELHFFSCTLRGAPRPLLGQEMRWAARGELRSLAFPPADEALIQLLERGG